MTEKYFITIDMGGTNTKAVFSDSQGRPAAISSFPTKRIENQAGFREIDLPALWQSIKESIKSGIAKLNIEPNQVKAIATVGHGKGLYLLDKEGKIFTNGILSTDERGNELAESFEARIDEIWPVLQQHIVGSHAPVLLRWLKDHQPEIYAQIGYVLSAKDFIRTMLTGVIRQEIGDASGNIFVNAKTRDYDPKILEFFGIAEIENCLPELVEATDIVGNLKPEVAEELGLSSDIPVIGGLFDIQACLTATGVASAEQFGITAGTWSINVYPDQQVAAQKENLLFSFLPKKYEVPYLIESSSATSAGNLDIMVKQLFYAENQLSEEKGVSVYDNLESLLENTDASFSNIIYLPFLYGSNVNSQAMGSFIGLDSRSTRSQMIHSVYEGVVFAHKQHIEQLIRAAGKQPEVIRISGGATNSNAWMQMFSDILNLPVETVTAVELGGLGGMMAASVALGETKDFSAAINKFVHIKQRYLPDAAENKIYEEKYQVYQTIIQGLDKSWQALRKLEENNG